MNTPQPTDIRPIYDGKMETHKLYVNGKEYPVNETAEIKYGTFDCEQGTVKYFNGDTNFNYWKRHIVDSGFNADWKCTKCGYICKLDFPPEVCPKCGIKGEKK